MEVRSEGARALKDRRAEQSLMRALLTVFLILLWIANAGAATPPGIKGGSPEIGPKSQEPGSTQRIECPKTTDPSALSLKAPSRSDYVKLVENLFKEYGEKTAPYRGQIDAVLLGATAPGEGADLGAIFKGLGAGPAAVYATSWSAKKNPDDALTANNLGVALKDMGEYRTAMAVLLYADRLQPNAPLVLVNRAWVHYELGDLDGAKPLFEKVALQAPALTSAQIGLGLVAYCRGDKTTAEKHFRKALEARMTPAMAAAWRQARGEGQQGESPRTSEFLNKDGEFRLPEMPSKASIKAMASAGPMIQNLGESLDNQLKLLMERKQDLSKVVAKQWNRTSQEGPEGIVVYRSLETTAFLFRDIARLVFAEKGRLGEAMSRLGKWGEETSQHAEALVPDIERDVQKTMDNLKQYEAMLAKHQEEDAALDREREKMEEEVARLEESAERRCNPNKIPPQGWTAEMIACGERVARQIDDVRGRFQKREEELSQRQRSEMHEFHHQSEKESYEACERDRKFREGMVQAQAAALGAYNKALRETLTDYYTFTTPVIESAFSPSMGELLNVEREIAVLTFLRNLASQYEGLASNAESVASLKCFPPSEEEPPPEPEEPNVPKTKPWCPFEKRPLKLKVLVIGFELDCEKVKLEGGELLLGSIERKFKSKETTIFLGVGANLGITGAGVGAKVGGSVTFQGDQVTNAAMESEVSGQVGITSATLTGRLALEGGPDISTSWGNSIGMGIGPVSTGVDL